MTTRVRVFQVYDDGHEGLIDELLPSQSSPGHYWAEWNSNTQPNGRYRFYAFAVFTPAGYLQDQCWTPATNFTLGNPSPTRMASAEDLNCPCRCDKVSTGSSTSPLEGHQSFTIPITSWQFRGQTFGFSITYDSHAIRDPQGLESPELAGLSERNSHWSHTYAQWIDLYRDQTGKQYAVWHHEGGTTAFPYNAVTGQYESPESNLTITASGPAQSSPSYPCDGMMKTLQTLHKSFVIQVADGTQYKFNVDPYMGEPHLVWRTGECSAIPFYLLSRITTRLGRELMLTWSTGAEPRVTQVRDETGAVRLTLTNTGTFSFLTSVVDSLGRTHSFVPAAVPDENGTNRQKLARAGSGLPDQITQNQYDGGGALTVGNLTRITEAFGTPVQQQTDLFYEGTDGAWGLPTRIHNEVGADSTADYDNTTGLLISSSSPANLVVGSTHPDRPASTTVLQYNSDQLPSLIRDALSHDVTISYAAASAGSPNLVVKYSFADGSYRTVTLDGMDRVIEAVDELGFATRTTYTPDGKTKTIRQAAGTGDERLTTYYYNAQGDLNAIDPPQAGGSRIGFEYFRYNPDGTLAPGNLYEGQVTRLWHPGELCEFFGYNQAGELAWKRKIDGTLITLDRDAQHRVKQVNYPASMRFPAFSVSASFDEFDRTVSTTDGASTTAVQYDALDRPLSVTPPSPQKALTYAYTPDTTLQRWITSINLAGVGNYELREDTKGRLAAVLNPFGQLFTSEFDKDSKETVRTFPNGVQELRSYTPRDWLGEIQLKQANGTVRDTLDYRYTDSGGAYDATGRLRGETSGADGYREFEPPPDLPEIHREYRERVPGITHYSYTPNGTRVGRAVEVGGVYTWDTYAIWLREQIVWVNRAGNFPPTSGQAQPYTILAYDADGRLILRERRAETSGPIQVLELYWDGADHLREVKENGVVVFTAAYNGEGLRVSKWDLWTGQHDVTWGPGGVLYDSNGSTAFTPGLAQRSGSTDRFFHTDWLGSTRWMSDGANGNSFPVYALFDTQILPEMAR